MIKNSICIIKSHHKCLKTNLWHHFESRLVGWFESRVVIENIWNIGGFYIKSGNLNYTKSCAKQKTKTICNWWTTTWKIWHSFSKSNGETQMEICVLILSTPICCKTSENVSKYKFYASMCLWQSHACCFDRNASKYQSHDIMKCMNAVSSI